MNKKSSFGIYTTLHKLIINKKMKITKKILTFSFQKLDNSLIDHLAFLGLTNLEIVYLGENPISTIQQSFVIQLCLTNPKCIICLSPNALKPGCTWRAMN